MVLLDGLVQDRAGYRAGLLEHVGQVDAAGLPALDGLVLIQALNVADALLKSPEAELGEDLAHLLSDEHEEVDHVLGLALKAGAQLRILGGNACGQVFFWQARIMTQLPRSGCGSEAEFLGTKQAAMTTSRPVLSSPSHWTTMRERRPFRISVWLGFGQADLPRGAGVLDGVERGCTRTAS